MISFEFYFAKWHNKTPKPLWFRGFPNRYLFRFAFLVAGTGCGCPVDTSVQSTEAPTEAAAETPNLFAQTLCVCLPSCGAQKLRSAWSACNFRPLRQQTLPASATGGGRVCCPGNPSVAGSKQNLITRKNLRSKKNEDFFE